MSSQKLGRLLQREMLGFPGVFESYFWLHDQLKRPPRNDSGFRHFLEWLNEAQKAMPGSKSLKGRVLFISYLPELIDFSLAISAILVARGLQVDFIWISHTTNTHEKRLLQQYIQREGRRLRTADLPDTFHIYCADEISPAAISPEMTCMANKQAYLDTVYIRLKENVDIEGDAEDQATFTYREQRNLAFLGVVARLLEQQSYDRVIMPNGKVMELGAAYRYLTDRGIPVSTFEMWDLKGRIVASDNEPVVHITTQKMWDQEAPHILKGERRAEIEKVMQDRETPSSQTLRMAYQKVGLASDDETRKQLGLSPDKPVILICPNVPFDSVFYGAACHVFEGMSIWLVKTVEYLSRRDDYQVVVRSHPAEPYYNSKETVRSLLAQHLPPLPEHIHVVAPEASVNTYSLMKIASLGLVYASTTGLEMAMRGLPVICGSSRQHYNHKGFTMDPDTPEEYFSLIDRVLIQPTEHRLSPQQIDLALYYGDIYFNRWPRPFPWYASQQFWQDIRDFPVSRMFSAEAKPYDWFIKSLLPASEFEIEND